MVRVALFLLAFGLVNSLNAQQPGVIPNPGSGTPVGYQPGGIPPVAAGIDPKLMGHLKEWEARMKSVENVVCKADKVLTDKVLNRMSAKEEAEILCLKPNYAFMKVVKSEDAQDFSTWICDGKSIHQYTGKRREYSEFKLQANGQIQGNLLLEFISGAMTAQGALQRFQIKLTKEDANYVFLEIKPTLVSDREDFEVMTLVFYGPNLPANLAHLRYLPALVIMARNQNKEEEKWTFKTPQVNVKGLTATSFQKQKVPADWKVVPAAIPSSLQNGPRVARPQQP